MKKVSPTEQICMNAMHELIGVKMINRISVQDIIDMAGISKATFYRHYTDKYDLYEKMLRRDVEHIFTDSCTLREWPVRIRSFAHAIQKEQKFYYRMVRDDPGSFTMFYTNVLYNLMERRLARLHGKPYTMSHSLHLKCMFTSAGTAALLCDWITGGCAASADNIADEICSMIETIAKGTELHEKNAP